MKKFSILRLCVLASLLLTLACTTPSGPVHTRKPSLPTPTTEMKKAFQRAEKLYASKNTAEAKLAYQSYIDTFSMNALSIKAYFRLGEMAYFEKNWDEAITDYKKSTSKGLDPEWGSVALFKMSGAYSHQGDYKKALSLLDQVPWSRLDGKVALRVGSLRVTVAQKNESSESHLEEIKGYLELLDAYDILPAAEMKLSAANWIISQDTAEKSVKDWIALENDSETSIATLKKWLSRFEGKTSGAYTTWKLALLTHQKGDYKNAADWASQYRTRYPKHLYVSEALKMMTEAQKRGVVAEDKIQPSQDYRPSIGVLLPLSGKLAVYGESVLHGLECANGIYTPCRGDLGVNLIIRDTGGDPKTAAKLVSELSQNPEIKAIIGPLPQAEVEPAAQAAEKAKTPLLALSQKPGVAELGDYIFRNFLTPQDQVSTIVDYACRQKKWRKLGILYPAGPTGDEYHRLFLSEVKSCGGKVVADIPYPESTRNYADYLKKLEGASQETKVDAIFIPDVYRRVSEIIATIKFINLPSLKLLGGPGWNHPDLTNAENRDINDAVFVDGFFAKSSHFATRDFVAMFQEAYGVEPTLLEAYAYDTLRLISDILKDNTHMDRQSLQQALQTKSNFNGVTGTISFDSTGDARRKLFLMTIHNGTIKELE